MSEFMSLKLSQVMGDIGVTEKMVNKRRRSFMVMEAIATIISRDLGGKKEISYNIGSQSEGSTTIDLDSDFDKLFEHYDVNLIQDREKAQNAALLVQDKSTAHGHCFLQVQSRNIWFDYPDKRFHANNYFKDKEGRLLLKNTCFDDLVTIYDERNGPAHTLQRKPGQINEDNVIGLHCRYWPNEAQQWLVEDGKRVWPSEDLKRECEGTGCTIVPISSKGSEYEELEWRISTCLAERRLMFSLNITQMRCYVLMKMIRKTFIEPKYPGTISSYICKTVLFHCLRNEISLNWHENQLMGCLMSCLRLLEEFVRAEICSHFIIPGNNLLKGKISENIKDRLLNTLLDLKKRVARYLCEIKLDDLGARIMGKTVVFTYLGGKVGYRSMNQELIQSFISMTLLWHIATHLSVYFNNYLNTVMLALCKHKIICFRYDMDKLTDLYEKTESELEKTAYQLLIPFLRSSLTSTMASNYLDKKKSILALPDVITNFTDGINSDVSSGKLKLASALFCSGEFDKTNDILITLQHKYDTKIVETTCKCYNYQAKIRQGFIDGVGTGSEELIRDITSFCIRFLPCEVNCFPRELQYEMFRSTTKDKLHRHHNNFWMDWAVVDSLPYLYFLQCKMYGLLQEIAKQRKALSDLAETIKIEPNLGHRETALNLLGQCMEQENCFNEALNFYIQSLNIRPRNNAANIHICIMISTLVNRKYGTELKKKSKENKKQNKNLRKKDRKKKLR